MEYTVVLSATASDPAPLQYIAPYSGTALAEYFMYQGKDVLIVMMIYPACGRLPGVIAASGAVSGREAYPGDVFYLPLPAVGAVGEISDEKGGGSITALPIIETQAGDVSALYSHQRDFHHRRPDFSGK